jgi:signal transduction histidine kinase
VIRRRWWLAVLATICAVWVLGGEWVSVRHHVPENHLIDALGGLAYLTAGIIVLDRRPGNLIGPLMIAYGMAGYFGNWGNLNVPLLPLLGVTIGQWAGPPILAQIALSYPDGRLRSRIDRLVTGLIYAGATAIVVVILLVFDPRSAGCGRCAWEPAPFPDRSAYLRVTAVYQRVGGLLALLFLLAILLKFRRATPAERRDLIPLWGAAAVIALTYLLGVFASADPGHDSFSYLLWELQAVFQLSVPILLAWGLLSARLARSAVGDLVEQLDQPLSPEELQASLSHALRDPSLELMYARQEQGGWLTARGQPGSLPRPGDGPRSRAITLVERDRRPLAALVHDPALEHRLIRAAAAAAGMAIDNARLHAELRAQLEEVRASRQRIVEAADRERRRVERNLHDGAQQRLATLALSLAMLCGRDDADPAHATPLAAALTELRQAIEELRELARGIHPAILTEEGLPAAVESLADRSVVPVRTTADFEARLPGPVEAVAYFVVSESLANVAKYARASGARIELSRCDGWLRVEVADDGVGGADPARGSGLRGLEDRVCAIRGTFRVDSPPGGGTRVQAEIPCPSEQA